MLIYNTIILSSNQSLKTVFTSLLAIMIAQTHCLQQNACSSIKLAVDFYLNIYQTITYKYKNITWITSKI